MIVTTLQTVPKREISEIIGIVDGVSIQATDPLRDMVSSVRDFFGGRAKGLEDSLKKARDTAIEDMLEEAEGIGATAVVGIRIDYEHLEQKFMTVVTGTAVRLE